MASRDYGLGRRYYYSPGQNIHNWPGPYYAGGGAVRPAFSEHGRGYRGRPWHHPSQPARPPGPRRRQQPGPRLRQQPGPPSRQPPGNAGQGPSAAGQAPGGYDQAAVPPVAESEQDSFTGEQGADAAACHNPEGDAESQSRDEPKENIPVKKTGDEVQCAVCQESIKQDFTQACFIFDEKLGDDFIKNKNKNKKSARAPVLRKFLIMVNTLLNAGGGFICVHTEARVMAFWDEKIDHHLKQLVPDDTIFNENYERQVKGQHMIFRVKPRDRPSSILEFNTKVSLNKGLDDPTQQQMRRLMTCRPCPDDSFFPPSTLNTATLEEGQNVEFHENANMQAKVVFDVKQSGKGKDEDQLQCSEEVKTLFDHCWNNLRLPEYIAAFSKQVDGGSCYFGLQEHKDEPEPKWKEAQPQEGVDLRRSKFKLWFDEGNKKVFHLAAEKDVPQVERKTGKFKCKGISLSSRQQDEFKEKLNQYIKTEMLWTTVPGGPNSTDPDHAQRVSVHFHKVPGSQQLCVIEVQVNYFHGVCYQTKDGFAAYTFDNPDNPQHTVRFSKEKWEEQHQV